MMDTININKDKLIEIVNVINECCAVMDHDYVAEWLTTPHSFLNMNTPINEAGEGQAGIDKIYRLLYFIDIGEADLT